MLASYIARNYAMYALASQYHNANLPLPPNFYYQADGLQEQQQQQQQQQPQQLGHQQQQIIETIPLYDGTRSRSQEVIGTTSHGRRRKHSRTARAASSEIKFSIDRILSSDEKNSGNKQQDVPETHGGEISDVDDDDDSDIEINVPEAEEMNRVPSENLLPENTHFSWLQCTRYKPPKLQRIRKKDGCKKRKLGRNPRVPFTQHQVASLEQKFCHTHYLSSMDVADLSTALNLTETRVKIWFQNRRARERRDRDTKPMMGHDLSHPGMAGTSAWTFPTPPTQQTLTQLQEALQRGNSAFAPIVYGHKNKDA